MKTILRSQELTCPSCIAKIEKALKGVPGVVDARVYFNSGKIEVEHDKAQASPEQLAKTVEAIGYKTRVSLV